MEQSHTLIDISSLNIYQDTLIILWEIIENVKNKELTISQCKNKSVDFVLWVYFLYIRYLVVYHSIR